MSRTCERGSSGPAPAPQGGGRGTGGGRYSSQCRVGDTLQACHGHDDHDAGAAGGGDCPQEESNEEHY